jgi:hypothetical protein
MLTEVVRDVPLSVQANTEIALRLGDDHFLPNHFQVVVHQIWHQQMICSNDADTIVEKPNTSQKDGTY